LERALPFIENFCKTFEAEGIHTTLKHLPGHGPSEFDSHQKIAVLFKPKRELFREDLEIFRKASAYASCVMTAHIAYEEDPERLVSMDVELVEELRNEMMNAPDLLWITDDL